MASTSVSFSSVAKGTAVLLRNHQQMTYNLTGSFDATLQLVRSVDGGASWEVLVTLIAGDNKTITIDNKAERTALIRWQCVEYNSGTAVSTISTLPYFVAGLTSGEAEIYNNDGAIELWLGGVVVASSAGQSIVYPGTGDTSGNLDTSIILAALAANPTITIQLIPGRSYYFNERITLDSGQHIEGNGAIISRPAQVSFTNAATVVTASAQTFTTTNTSGWKVGQYAILKVDSTHIAYAQVTSIARNTSITVGAKTIGSGLSALPWASSTVTVANTYQQFRVEENASIDNIWMVGSSAVVPTTEIQRWEVTGGMLNRGGVLTNIRFRNYPGEAIIENPTVVGTISANIAAGATSMTMGTGYAAQFSVGDALAYADSAWTAPHQDREYHFITDITGNVVTVFPPLAYAAASATTTTKRLTQFSRYENIDILNIGGNGLHRSGSVRSYTQGYHVSTCNQGADVGHQEGAFTWSNWCYDSEDHSPFAANTSLAGFGGLDSEDNSGAKIFNPIIVDCAGNSINIQSLPGFAIYNVYVENPTIIDCGLLNMSCSTNTEVIGPTNCTVKGGRVVRSMANFLGGYSNQLLDVTFDWFAAGVPATTVKLINVDGAGLTVRGCKTLGGYFGLYVAGTRTNQQTALIVEDNKFWFTYQNPVWGNAATNPNYSVTFRRNDVRDLSSTNATPGWESNMPYNNSKNGENMVAHTGWIVEDNTYVLTGAFRRGLFARAGAILNRNTIIIHTLTASGILTGAAIDLESSGTVFGSKNKVLVSGNASYTGGSAIVPLNNTFKRFRNTGTASLSAATSIVVTHGLAYTPLIQDILLTPQGACLTPPYVTTVTATQFTINIAAPTTVDIGWAATVPYANANEGYEIAA